MTPLVPEAWCACCGDARSGRLCARCKADPANADWVEDDELQIVGESQARPEWSESKEWAPSDTLSKVARLRVAGNSEREIAGIVGRSRALVRKLLRKVGL